ncbi:hypothetical protein K469DRAFT_84552 [Zopfia rhizophila CBS 207.26]|uniref:Heterokaryon incompatibility domain-containing protein n=1 Tax=Zopfia rhizophila CBS 207.26 TaxID=1314779 RepID=A0A6A6E9U7_9PEZI|nr:hypothetical protein K469DRAFT_84552 [Zopfia rhizophila CBS 207.26]
MVCEDYTPRGIAYPTDKLSAVSSLMHSFMPHLGKYYAGLWEHNLIMSLQWEATNTALCMRHEEYVTPSFSWASISGGVIWYFDIREISAPDTHEFANIVDISCELARNDPCGPVSSGHITLRGYTSDMKIEESKLMWLPDGRLEMTKDDTESCYVTLDSKQDFERVEPGMTVKCLDIMRDKEGLHDKGLHDKGLHDNYISGLVLLPVDHDRPSHYCGIGFSTMLKEHFKDSALESATIV